MTLTKAILLTLTLVGMGLAPAARAAHATEFLDPLQNEIATRLENLPDDTSADVRRALNKANAALNKNTKSVAADLGALAAAGRALGGALAEDGTLVGLQNDAVNAFSAAAQNQLNAVFALVGESEPPRALAKQLDQAQAALDRANDDTNTIDVRAKAVAFALNKIRAANILAIRLFKAPVDLNGRVIEFTSKQSSTIVLSPDGTYTVGDPEAPEDAGTWVYARTSSNTGTVTLSAGRVLELKFVNTRGGSYTETNDEGTVRGKFTMQSVL